MQTIDISNMSPESLEEVLLMAQNGASIESINRLLAVSTHPETLYAARTGCLSEDNSAALLRAAKDVRISMATS